MDSRVDGTYGLNWYNNEINNGKKFYDFASRKMSLLVTNRDVRITE